MKQELIDLLRNSTKKRIKQLYKICNEDSILKEYNLIKDKKSNLSKSERTEILTLVEIDKKITDGTTGDITES